MASAGIVFIIAVHFHSAYLARSCTSTDVCRHYSECRFYQDMVTKIKTEKDISSKKLIIKDLWSRVCDRRHRFVCCPGETDRTEIVKKESPLFLPTKEECSIYEDKPTTLIFGGHDSSRAQFPFSALIGITKLGITVPGSEGSTKWVCGGTLINLWYVVTAAHCHQEKDGRGITRVRLGEWIIGQPDPHVQDFIIDAQDMTIHERYKHSNYIHYSQTTVHNDIALVRLPNMAKINAQVGLACLPLSQSGVAGELGVKNLGHGLTGRSITTVGWGYAAYQEDSLLFCRDSGYKGSRTQKYLELSILHRSKCEAPINSNMFCAGKSIGEDICKGDSGGGAFMRGKGGHGPWYLIGVASSVSRFCGSGKPRIFTSVVTYIEWIKKNLVS